MDTDKKQGEEPFMRETHEIIGAAMEVLNELGHGFHEKPYEKALTVEFSKRFIPYEQQARYPLIYKGVHIHDFIPDLVCFGKVIIDTKTINMITEHEVGQMLNYLKISGLRVGLILNFKKPKLEWKRVIR